MSVFHPITQVTDKAGERFWCQHKVLEAASSGSASDDGAQLSAGTEQRIPGTIQPTAALPLKVLCCSSCL